MTPPMTHSEPAREAVAAGRRRDISSPERSFWETQRQIAHVEADEAATRLINSHFKNDAERARVSIPANPERDDDLIIRSYIRQQARLSASPAPAAGVEAVREIAPPMSRPMAARLREPEAVRPPDRRPDALHGSDR